MREKMGKPDFGSETACGGWAALLGPPWLPWREKHTQC